MLLGTFVRVYMYRKIILLYRRGTLSGHPPLLKKPLSGKATTFLPKLDQHSNNGTHIPAQSAKKATAAVADGVVSLPNIYSSSNSNVTLSQNPSDSDVRFKFKRLTIQIPSASSDSVHISQSTTREKLPKANCHHHHSNTNNKIHSPASSSLSSKSKSRSVHVHIADQLSDHSLLAPICNSYSGAPVAGHPTRQRSDKQLIEGSTRKSSKTDSTFVHGVYSEDGERDEGMILAVLPATGNLSSSRFNELKQTNGTPLLHSLPLSVGGAKQLRRGSLVMPVKRCISLRVSVKKISYCLLDPSRPL